MIDALQRCTLTVGSKRVAEWANSHCMHDKTPPEGLCADVGNFVPTCTEHPPNQQPWRCASEVHRNSEEGAGTTATRMASTNDRKVAVVGGGISGLSAAWLLQK